MVGQVYRWVSVARASLCTQAQRVELYYKNKIASSVSSDTGRANECPEDLFDKKAGSSNIY